MIREYCQEHILVVKQRHPKNSFNLHILILSETMLFFVTTLKFSSYANSGCGNGGHKWI